ncbi:hypothetical protein [Neoaquamicrobium sediminum]|uniref:hypothetical protein n=1 Tax=Neoaquamicrobium sediminum TaxID=1849104 RepID=UPI003BAD7B49
MYHSTELHRMHLHFVENDTSSRAFCGPTALAALTGQPISVVRDACRMARHGNDWPARLPRAPRVRGVSNVVLEKALRLLGFTGRWVRVAGNPTLAAWLERRTREERYRPCIVNVTGHYVTVSGYEFVDTFTRGKVVDVGEAPGRRKRVQRVFIVTAKVTPTPIVTKKPAPRTPRPRGASSDYRAFVSYARSVGATYRKERGSDELEILCRGGRSLWVTHSLLPDDWGNAQMQLENFLATPEPDPDLFNDHGGGQWWALTV